MSAALLAVRVATLATSTIVAAGCDIAVCDGARGGICCNTDDDCGVPNQICGDEGVCEVRTVDGVVMIAVGTGGLTTFDARDVAGTLPMALFGLPDGAGTSSLSGFYDVLGVAEGGAAVTISISDLAGRRDACPEGIIVDVGGASFTTAGGPCGSLDSTLDEHGNLTVSWRGTEGPDLGLMIEPR